MIRTLVGWVGLLISLGCVAQSTLPPCPQGVWTNCFGTLRYNNGAIYSGGWKDGTPHGQGTYTYADGDKYVGEHRDGKRDGLGVFIFNTNNGIRYVGEWKADLLNGQGIIYDANQRITQSGFYENSKLVRSSNVDSAKFSFNFPFDSRQSSSVQTAGNSNSVTSIGGVNATDMDGYLTIQPQFYYMPSVRNTISISISQGRGNPLDRIPKRPGAIYPNWSQSSSQFDTPDGFIAQWERLRPSDGVAQSAANNSAKTGGPGPWDDLFGKRQKSTRQECYQEYNDWRQQSTNSGYNDGIGVAGLMWGGTSCYRLQQIDESCKEAGVRPSPIDGELKRCVAAEQNEWVPKCNGARNAANRCAPSSTPDECMARLGYGEMVVSRCERMGLSGFIGGWNGLFK